MNDDEIEAIIADFEAWLERGDFEGMRELPCKELHRVGQLANQRDAIEEQLSDAVGAAREEGWSWGMIGMVMGVSKQAVHQKYGGKNSAA